MVRDIIKCMAAKFASKKLEYDMVWFHSTLSQKVLFFFKLNAGGGLGGGGSKKGPNFQGEALRQMLSQHMVRWFSLFLKVTYKILKFWTNVMLASLYFYFIVSNERSYRTSRYDWPAWTTCKYISVDC